MQPQTINAEDIDKQKDYEIYSLILKDSSKIIINDPEDIRYIKKPADSTGTFLYILYDNIYKKSESKVNLNASTNLLSLNKVAKIEIGKSLENHE